MKGLHPVTNLLYLYLYSHQQSPKVLLWKIYGGNEPNLQSNLQKYRPVEQNRSSSAVSTLLCC